jgi:hypothetical protein
MIPDYARRDLEAYLHEGQPLSDTFADLVSGEIYSAANRADEVVLASLTEILIWIMTAFPADAYGTRKKYAKWIEVHRNRRSRAGPNAEGYPLDWPRCPSCNRPALDGYLTCGDVRCSEGSWRGGAT